MPADDHDCLDIIYEEYGVGYGPLLHMVRLAAELLGGRLILLPAEPVRRRHRLEALLPSRRGRGAGLLICNSPSGLLSMLRVPEWRRRYDRVGAWVFDSFWVDRIPRLFRLRRHLDRLFVAEPEDLGEWEQRLRIPVDWLPWGSDVLRLGSASPERPVDLLRVGRQPPQWEDDRLSDRDCRQAGLIFHGRPAYSPPQNDQRFLMSVYAKAKFTLSFSNSVAPQDYTHPIRRYITGRWTDALAAGAIVAGIPPESSAVDSLLWPGALLDLETVDRHAGLMLLKEAVQSWTPQRARTNHLNALDRLDWRRRLATIAASLELDAPRLRDETAQLEERLRSGGPASSR